jgi:hypothetical protein
VLFASIHEGASNFKEAVSAEIQDNLRGGGVSIASRRRLPLHHEAKQDREIQMVTAAGR